jgi:preprotein translocase subunit SecF
MNLINEKAIDSYVKNFNFKHMLYFPAILLLVSLLILAYTSFFVQGTLTEPGSPVELGMEFQGGTVMFFDSDKTLDQLNKEFALYNVIKAGEDQRGIRKFIQFGPMTESDISEASKKINSNYKNVEIRQMGEVVSKSLQGQALRAVLLSFLGMAIVVFLIFKTFVPSVAVVISAFADIVFALAMMNIFGISLSMGTVAALLMLIGYSVDTDILLTTRLLKRKGELNDKIKDAMKTGMTMTITTLAALTALFLVSSGSYLISSFTRIDIIRDVSVVLIFGLIADIINTWMTNLGVLKWYMEKTGINEKRIETPKKRRHTS